MDDPQPLPTQTTDPISRPSSTSTTASANLQQLPGISALAASDTVQNSLQLRATVAPQNPTYTGATPPSTNGNGNLQQQQQQQQQAQGFGLADVNGTDFAAQNAAAQAIRRTSQKSNGNEGSDSPLSRNGTPSMYTQAMTSFMVDDPYQMEHGDSQTHEQLIAYSSSLKTRVSELEVINELFRGRLSQLEQQEAAARRGQEVAGEEQSQLRDQLEAALNSEGQLRAQLDDSHRRENNLKRRLDELELELQALKGIPEHDMTRPNKRPRVDEHESPTSGAFAYPKPVSEPEQEEFHDPMLQAVHTEEDLNPPEETQVTQMSAEEPPAEVNDEAATIEEVAESTEAAPIEAAEAMES
ncbi:probable GATA type zinc finger protein asd4 [Claviceps purpurea 20.1]|uniref:Probable GATA type zinc finger protein asd4 n=1 Tax=Claviceps purpurea (strain 20.1) TaxID=1111077 RepID=M1VZE3_CLAP2|nr:probable GATA type zinc finger protein asd4 [Claviceps purpurea 20.1]